jgi:hypothetical protein
VNRVSATWFTALRAASVGGHVSVVVRLLIACEGVVDVKLTASNAASGAVHRPATA